MQTGRRCSTCPSASEVEKVAKKTKSERSFYRCPRSERDEKASRPRADRNAQSTSNQSAANDKRRTSVGSDCSLSRKDLNEKNVEKREKSRREPTGDEIVVQIDRRLTRLVQQRLDVRQMNDVENLPIAAENRSKRRDENFARNSFTKSNTSAGR